MLRGDNCVKDWISFEHGCFGSLFIKDKLIFNSSANRVSHFQQSVQLPSQNISTNIQGNLEQRKFVSCTRLKRGLGKLSVCRCSGGSGGGGLFTASVSEKDQRTIIKNQRTNAFAWYAPLRPKIFSISFSFWKHLVKSYVGVPWRVGAPPTGNPGSAPAKGRQPTFLLYDLSRSTHSRRKHLFFDFSRLFFDLFRLRLL